MSEPETEPVRERLGEDRVREREVGIHSEEALRARFEQLDPLGKGLIDVKAYIIWSLKEVREGARVAA